MSQHHLNGLREQVRFEEWRDRPPAGDDVFVVRLGLTGDEIPGWHLDSSRSVQDASARTIVYSTWISDSDDRVALRVDAEITSSRTEAREELLQRLSSIQLARIERLPEGSVGDVGFALGANTVVLFARGNTVIEFAPLAAGSFDVLAVARSFDEHLVGRPSVSTADAGATGGWLRSAGAKAWNAALADSAPGVLVELPDAPSVRSAYARRRRHDELGLPADVPLPVDETTEPSDGTLAAASRPAEARTLPTVKLLVRGAEIREQDGHLTFIAADTEGREIELVEHDGPVADGPNRGE